MAAHQIALQVIHFSFMPAFAVGEGAAVLAGRRVGADHDELVIRIARLATKANRDLHRRLYAAVDHRVTAAGRRVHRRPGGRAKRDIALLHIAAAFQVLDGRQHGGARRAARARATCAIRRSSACSPLVGLHAAAVLVPRIPAGAGRAGRMAGASASSVDRGCDPDVVAPRGSALGHGPPWPRRASACRTEDLAVA